MCVDRLEGSYVTAQHRRKLPGKSCEGARATFDAGGPCLFTLSLFTSREAGVRRQAERVLWDSRQLGKSDHEFEKELPLRVF